MLMEVGPDEQVIYEEDLIHEANMRAEKKEKLMKPIRLEVKMELAYDLISEVNADVAGRGLVRQRRTKRPKRQWTLCEKSWSFPAE